MNRNEYRRAFIMLRAALQGYGGHVRLERRTLTGNMYFVVTAPQGVGELSAALVGQQNGKYYAAPVGALSRDRRGQLALAWPFDPRSIGGRPLDAYAWVAVAATGGPCAVALVGNVEGSRPLDREALERAVCELFSSPDTGMPADDLPSPGELMPNPDSGIFSVEEAQVDPPAGDEAPEDSASEMRGDVKIYLGSRARQRAVSRVRDGAGNDTPTPVDDPGAPDSDPSANGGSSDYSRPETAAQRLGLDITSPWPEDAEPLRRLFATQPAVDAPFDDGYIYISAPLPASPDGQTCLIGLRAKDGRISGIRYALPGRQSPEPPAGLEAYTWTPTDGGQGYWVLTSDLSI